MGESQNGCFKKKHAKFSGKKTNISYPLTPYPLCYPRTCAYQGARNVRFFSENLACFV